MTDTKIMIIADSSADVTELCGAPFKSVPLKIITAEKEYVDDASLDVEAMVNDLASYKGRSSTSCPSTGEWLDAFGGAERVFCVTITGTLSGSYNAACSAAKIYEETYPERKVFVINSLSTGPECGLILEKLRDLVNEGREFEDICEEIEQYTKKTGLIFMLECMRNLANNGRVSPIVAKMAGLLGIRVVAKASDRGDIETLGKCRGEDKALDEIVKYMEKMGVRRGKVRIAHCFNEGAAGKLCERLTKTFPEVKIQICPSRGLCSFYAEKGGLLIGFEKE